MTTILNRMGLPPAVVKAVTREQRVRGDYEASITELLKPVRQVVLERRHADKMSMDAADAIWMLVGQIGHMILERGSSEELTEKRLYTEEEGIKVSGQVDLVNGTTLVDYKFTSVWGLLKGVKTEWVKQTNLYSLLCHRNGIEIKDVQIIAIYRDWSVMEARRSSDYPQEQVQVFSVPIWPREEQERFFKERVLAYKNALKDLPECSPEERWEKPTVYALMKIGAKRATKLFDTLEEAEAEKKSGMEVVTRPGESVRCQYYCALSKLGLCSQFKEMNGEP